MQMDINEDGIAELVKVVCLGESNPSVILDLEEVPAIPFVSVQAIPKPIHPSAFPCLSA